MGERESQGAARRRRRRRRRWAGVGASAVLHGLVLAGLGWSVAPRLPSPPERPSPPAVRLSLVLAPQRGTRAPVAQAAAPTTPAIAPRAPTRPATAASAPTTQLPSAPPAVAAKGAGPDTTSEVGSGARPAPAGGGEPGADLRGFLRATVGCSHADYLHLTDAERARCDKGFATAARTAPRIDPLPAEKRAYYDAVVKAYEKTRAAPVVLAPRFADNLGVEERWSGPPGAHAAGFGCGVKFGVPRGWKSYHDKPPNSLKLGRLPCFITPPSGFATEEADVQAPSSLRERTDDAAHAAQFDVPKP